MIKFIFCFAILFLSTFFKQLSAQTLPKEELVFLTSAWKGERFADGRPKIPDALIERAKNIGIEEAWTVLRNEGYKNQFEGNWKLVHDDVPVVGRAVTAMFMPTRPDIEKNLKDRGAKQGRKGNTNAWPIDVLTKGDVYVADGFGKIAGGTLIGDNLGNSIYNKTGNGVIFDGSARDLQGLSAIKGFNAFVRDFDPSYLEEMVLIGLNTPIRIGRAIVLPGDLVLSEKEGVLFIPAHLAETVVATAEFIALRDEFSHAMLKAGTFSTGEIDSQWSEPIRAAFMKWQDQQNKKSKLSRAQLDEFMKKKNLVIMMNFLIILFVALAIGVRFSPVLKGYSYTLLIFAAVTTALHYPQYFVELNGFKFAVLITPLIQLIMFGMGTSMSFHDFVGVVKMPKGVIIGVFSHFLIMPLLGFTLASFSGFPPEIAAGIILIGCSPNGMASNVISYLAKANLALSITITAVSTLLSPFFTPFLMKFFAGAFIQIDILKMMWDITKMVIIPIGAGLVFNKLFSGKVKWLDKLMPLVSMFGITFIIVIITAAGRESLMNIGFALIGLVLIHNLLGYTFGYWSGRLFKMDERDCRTMAIEVGMQNGGLASGLAKEMGKMATVGLAPAVFGPLMNVTGSILASYWHRKPILTGIEISEPEEQSLT